MWQGTLPQDAFPCIFSSVSRSCAGSQHVVSMFSQALRSTRAQLPSSRRTIFSPKPLHRRREQVKGAKEPEYRGHSVLRVVGDLRRPHVFGFPNDIRVIHHDPDHDCCDVHDPGRDYIVPPSQHRCTEQHAHQESCKEHDHQLADEEARVADDLALDVLRTALPMDAGFSSDSW